MTYEFTKQKLVAERKARLRRWTVAVLAGGVGLTCGIAVNDMASIFGVLAAGVVATAAGFAGYFA